MLPTNLDKIISDLDKYVVGWYKPSVFHLNIEFEWDCNPDHLTPKDLGVILHEYIHYLQNITTPCGIWDSILYYYYISYICGTIQNPNHDFSSMKNDLMKMIGVCNAMNGSSDELRSINSISLRDSISNPIFNVHGIDKYGNSVSIDITLGSHIIKESMAYICQQMANPTAKGTSPELPYNFVTLLIEKNYPNLKDRLSFQVACLYLSLFSMRPGKRLWDLLTEVNALEPQNITEWINNHINNDVVTTKDKDGERRIAITDFYDEILNKLSNTLNKLPGVQSGYIDEVLQVGNLRNGNIPLVDPFKEDSFTIDDFKKMITDYGLPMVTRNEDYILHYPYDVDGNPSLDINLLWSYDKFMVLVRDQKKGCPLKDKCDQRNNDHHCASPEPWHHQGQCALRPIFDVVGLKSESRS